QVGQRSVTQPGRQKVSRERDAGDDVSTKPGGLVAPQPTRSRHHREPAARARRPVVVGCHCAHFFASRAFFTAASSLLFAALISGYCRLSEASATTTASVTAPRGTPLLSACTPYPS